MLDLTPPNIVYSPLGNTNSTGARTLTATITDATGVPTAGIGLPVLYWRINAGAYTPATASSLGGGQYQFSFGSGVAVGDTVSYYVVAQDTAGTPNVGSNPSTGASGFTANPPAAATPPTTPFSYAIQASITGTFTVGVAGNYTTLTNAVIDLNSKFLSGPVVLELLDAINTTVPQNTGEIFPIVIQPNGGSSLTNTITIKPATGVTATITGAVASNPLIKLNGASFVIIDGSNSGGTDRSLTIENTSTTAPSVLWVGSVGTTPITNVTVKNCIVRNGINTNTGTVISDAGDFRQPRPLCQYYRSEQPPPEVIQWRFCDRCSRAPGRIQPGLYRELDQHRRGRRDQGHRLVHGGCQRSYGQPEYHRQFRGYWRRK